VTADEFAVLLAPDGADPTDLDSLYAPPKRPWFRANMVSSLDGIAAGVDGRSGSINNELDTRVFALLRRSADAILVGAGTARTEGYRPTDRPIVVVSHSGAVPPTLLGAPAGAVILATHRDADHLEKSREALGNAWIWELGDGRVDVPELRQRLIDRGFTSVVCEGGPSLLSDALAAGVIDELCLTWVPRLLAGDMTRLLTGPALDLTLMLRMLLERNGTLLGRWWIGSSGE